MKHGSLFSGIGGFDLAAEWMGWENVFHCEWEEFPRKVLNYHWPNAVSYGDITKTDFNIHRGRIDILTGGFPCQPYSQAGKRLGKEDDRHLWPEMLRAIREVQPTWVVGENVRGLINWNGGLVFDEVQTDLEAEGYQVQPFLLPACAVNAPHRRDRIWFVAYSGSERTKKSTKGINKSRELFQETEWKKNKQFDKPIGESGPTPDTNKEGLPLRIRSRIRGNGKEEGTSQGSEFTRAFTKKPGWKQFPTQSPVCGKYDGFSSRLDGITFSKWRKESIKAYGNAIVPQVALQIFKAIEQYKSLP